MNKFPSTLLPQTSDPSESQKGHLDLLAKINLIAGGDTLSLSSKGYTEKAGDNYDMIAISTGSSSQTVTLQSAKIVKGRLRTYSKTDSGAGEVVLKCQGTDVIYYSGGSASTMYVGLQYQSAVLFAIAGGFLLVGGVTQPVAGEPSIGTLKQHPRDTTNRQVYSAAAPGAVSWSAAITDSFAPAGAKQLHACVQLVCTVLAVGIAEARLYFSDNNSNTPVYNQTSHPEVDMRFYANTGNVVAQTFDILIPLNSSLQFYIYRDATVFNLNAFTVTIKSLGYVI